MTCRRNSVGDVGGHYRNEWICWIELAKKAETRTRRIEWAVPASEKENGDPVVGLAVRIVEQTLSSRFLTA